MAHKEAWAQLLPELHATMQERLRLMHARRDILKEGVKGKRLEEKLAAIQAAHLPS